jgi:predicted acylesterase/phospholipase RssA
VNEQDAALSSHLNDYGIREHIGIAVDGGGVRGTIVAHGLIELEEILGTRPLINDPRVKVIAGTSTGSLIAAALAIGMTGEQILALYKVLGENAFSKAGTIRPFGKSIPLLRQMRFPIQVVRLMQRWAATDFLLYLLMPARYSFDPLRQMMRDTLKTYQPALGDNPTLGELGNFLHTKPNQPTLIITAVDAAARQTLFLKTVSGSDFGQMRLIDALLASSAIPTYFDPLPFRLPTDSAPRWLVDGGVGNYGNPALVVAWELADPRNSDRHYDPSTVTLYSFGTGHVSAAIYENTYGKARDWWALEWANHIPDLFLDDIIREQSRNIIAQYPGIDLRRFQVPLDRVIAADRWDLINTYLFDRGQELRRLIREDRHALKPQRSEAYDPEHIMNTATARIVKSQPTSGE